jgi:hypothetical protein
MAAAGTAENVPAADRAVSSSALLRRAPVDGVLRAGEVVARVVEREGRDRELPRRLPSVVNVPRMKYEVRMFVIALDPLSIGPRRPSRRT